jgi:hypothetical protein
MKALRLISVLYFVLLMGSCTPNPEEAIIGKWQDTYIKESSISFFEDGTFTIRNTKDQRNNLNSNYRFVDKKTIRIEHTKRRDKPFELFEVSFKGSKLILTNLDGNTYMYYDRIE